MSQQHEAARDVDDVDLRNSRTHLGVALYPVPSDDDGDPLRWPQWVKTLALLATALFNFTANFAGAGMSVAVPVLEMQFRKSASQVNALLTFNFLLLGIGNLFWVPLAHKFGKRFTLLISMAALFAILVWTAKEKEFNGVLAARCLSGFASAAGESIVPGIVSDVFFLHERAKMMSIYLILIGGATAAGPLVAGFVVQDSADTWRDFTWVCAAVAGFNLLAIFLLYPESNFKRPTVPSTAQIEGIALQKPQVPRQFERKPSILQMEKVPQQDAAVYHVDHVDLSLLKVWASVIQVDHGVSFWKVLVRPFLFLLCPPVLWAVLVYGAHLASQIILIFAFSSLLLAPPYFFASSSVGLMQIASIIGIMIGCYGGGYISDYITVRLIVKSGGVIRPEQRLISLLPACYIGPAGCILVAFSCAYKLHWIAIAFGFGMVSFGTVYTPNVVITYLVDAYTHYTGEILVVINVFKNLVAFLFLYTAVDWVNSQGWIQVYMIMFMLVTLSVIFAVPMYFFGEKFRNSFEKYLPAAQVEEQVQGTQSAS